MLGYEYPFTFDFSNDSSRLVASSALSLPWVIEENVQPLLWWSILRLLFSLWAVIRCSHLITGVSIYVAVFRASCLRMFVMLSR